MSLGSQLLLLLKLLPQKKKNVCAHLRVRQLWPDITAGQASRGTGQGGGGGQLVWATAKTAGPGQEARTAVLATQQSLLVSVLSQEESGNWLCCIIWTYVEGG